MTCTLEAARKIVAALLEWNEKQQHQSKAISDLLADLRAVERVEWPGSMVTIEVGRRVDG